MKNFVIRELKSGDMQKMLDLLRTRDELDDDGAEKRMQLMEWCAFRNPFAENEPTYFIAEYNGEIIAHLGRMPTEFIIKGKRQKGYFIHDLYVHPKYRKKGMGFFLSMSLYRTIENNSKSFCCLVWTNEINLEMQRRRGYYEQWADCYIKLLNPYEKLKKFLKQETLLKILSLFKILKPFLRIILLLGDLIVFRLTSSQIQVSEIDRFDFRFDNLCQSILHKAGICSYKSSSYLNWKFIDRPFSKMKAFAAQEEGQITGFIVLDLNPYKEYPEGLIVDIVADPQDSRTIVSLFKKSISYLRQQKVFSINCCLTDRRFVKILRRFLFFKTFSREPVMLANLEKFEWKETLMDINNWHLTYSDSDALMLMP